jgi:hypothetical protein
MNDETSLLRRVRPSLDRSVRVLDPTVTRALAERRARALGALHDGRGRPGPVGSAVLALGDWWPWRRFALPLAVLLIGAAVIAGWQTWVAQTEIGEIELVEDELPLDVLTDGGFDTWLGNTSAR